MTKLAVFCCAVVFAWPARGRAEFLLKAGEEAPPFALRTLDSEMFSLSEMKAQKKSVLLVFFSTACEACKQQLPVLSSVEQRWREQALEIVLVGTRDPTAELDSLVKEGGWRLKVVPDGFGRVATRFGVTSLPFLALVDPTGRILFQHQGEADDLGDLLDRQIAVATGQPGPLAASNTVESSGKPLVFGRVPARQGAVDEWKPLADFIAERLPGIKVVLQGANSYEQFVAGLRAGVYDLACAGALQYVEVENIYEPLVKSVRRDQEYYYGIVFVRDGHGISRLEQLRGKVIAFADERSTSGYLFPVLKLSEAGLRPGDYKALFVGGHEQVAKAVLEGHAVAGACFEDCRTLLLPDPKEREEKTSIIAYTLEIPADPILVRKSLPEALKERLRRTLLAVNDHPKLLERISEHETPVTGLAPAAVAEYDLVREALVRVRAR